jgi:hypothetical protein
VHLVRKFVIKICFLALSTSRVSCSVF